jgi:hypothetical protein
MLATDGEKFVREHRGPLEVPLVLVGGAVPIKGFVLSIALRRAQGCGLAAGEHVAQPPRHLAGPDALRHFPVTVIAGDSSAFSGWEGFFSRLGRKGGASARCGSKAVARIRDLRVGGVKSDEILAWLKQDFALVMATPRQLAHCSKARKAKSASKGRRRTAAHAYITRRRRASPSSMASTLMAP